MFRFVLLHAAGCLLIIQLFTSTTVRADVLTFESLPFSSAPYENSYNGDPFASAVLRASYESLGTSINFGAVEHLQQWNAGGVTFGNQFIPDFQSWTGWSWSRVQDGSTAGFGNQYAAYPGGGSDGAGGIQAGGVYAVAHGNGAWLNLPDGAQLSSVDLTNTTYAGLSMRDGDLFAKRFGGATGNDADFFRVTLTGMSLLNGLGTVVGAVTADLADFRFTDSSLDYILDDWIRVDLSALSAARSVTLSFESSDIGPFGISTPLYVAIDNLTWSHAAAVPEPAHLSVLAGCAAFGAAVCRVRSRQRRA